MNDKMLDTLEYNKIISMLKGLAVSDRARERIGKLRPYKTLMEVMRHRDETTQARLLLEAIGTPPLAAMDELDKAMLLLGKEAMLEPQQLNAVAGFLNTCRRMKQYLKRGEPVSPFLASYGLSIDPAEELEQEITRCIRGDAVDDRATPEIRNIRRQIETAGAQVKQRLDSLLRSHPDWFMESYVIQRNGHFALPVKREFRRMVEGTVIEASQSGATVFVEPESVRKAQEELNLLHIQEENEIRRVLYMLTGMVEDNGHTLNIDMEAMETLDFLFAKARLSIAMKARPPLLTGERRIAINGGRHPLLDDKTVVPLKFAIGNGIDAVLITGPNTGGKTVALKAVGLLSLMAQSGLHVPVDEDSVFPVFGPVLCDIGDGQSIEQNLSTFSSHLTNIINILKEADARSLVLLDELGSGTDPTEGMGLATALLEAFKASGCLLVATTHYPELKEFAENTPGFINARMAFDKESLLPLYRLELGIAGESCALYIAERLGLPEALVQRAREAAYGSGAGGGTEDWRTLKAGQKPGQEAGQVAGQKDYSGLFKADGDAAPAVKMPEKTEICSLKPGDSIRIRSNGRIGVVFAAADHKGDVGAFLY